MMKCSLCLGARREDDGHMLMRCTYDPRMACWNRYLMTCGLNLCNSSLLYFKYNMQEDGWFVVLSQRFEEST